MFAAVAVSGATTVLQAVRFGRIGAGYVLLMGTAGAFIAVCVAALAKGGPAMLATLVVISSLFQFALAARLSLLRRVLTPTVAGTVIMLIAVTVMPIVFDMPTQVREGAAPLSAPVSALATVLVITGLALKATGPLRLWAPVVGVIAGSVVAGLFGLYDVASVGQAAWIGIPNTAWPGFDLSFGPVFWALLPAFVFVTLVGAIETIGDGVAIQRVSWRRPRAVDFRAVQGAVAADGAGNLLSGLAGTVPNTTYSTSIAVTELTGVAARGVGVAIGVIFLALAFLALAFLALAFLALAFLALAFLALAFLPKALAAVLAIPPPVAAAYITVLLAMLFVTGMKMVIQDGIDYRKGLVVGGVVLGRRRLPERRDLHRVFRGIRRRPAAERHDGGRLRGDPDDPVHGVDGAPPPPAGSGRRSHQPAADHALPRHLRGAPRLGRGDGAAPGGRQARRPWRRWWDRAIPARTSRCRARTWRH